MKRAQAIITRAAAAYAQGSCLKAGQLIDVAYRKIGSRRVPATLRRLDERFERTCVRKHPLR
jgi:hypothetical protein